MLEVKNILEDIVKNDSEDSKEKLIELFRKDKELQKSVIDFLIEKLKQEETNKENQENKREDANTLTETTYNEWCNEYAESKNAIRCSSKSECSTYIKAKKLYKAGLSKDEIISIVKEELVPIGVNTNNENTSLNLSALKDDISMSEYFSSVKYIPEEESKIINKYDIFKERMFDVCSNAEELTNYLVEIFYNNLKSKNKDILWKTFGKYIYNNVLSKTSMPIKIPHLNEFGKYSYLFDNYEIMEVNLFG